MRAALLSKAALCICPPAMLATTAAYVPPVRSAVHKATRPAAKAPASRSAKPKQTAAVIAAVPCPPALIEAPFVPQTTFAEPVPAEGVSSPAGFLSGSPAPGVATTGVGPGSGGGGGDTGVVPVVPGTPAPPATPGAVPEPSSWSMLLLGFGILGAALRSRPKRKLARRKIGRRKTTFVGGGLAVAALEPVQALNAAGTAAASGSKMTVAAKLAMCVCPPALMVATVAAVPPVKKAVFAATAPRYGTPTLTPQQAAPACIPTDTVVGTI